MIRRKNKSVGIRIRVDKDGQAFLDPRSRMTKLGRTLLYGRDMMKLRVLVHSRAMGRCEAQHHASGCPSRVNKDTYWGEGHLHHKVRKGMGGGKRDDTPENTLWLSRACHKQADEYHRRSL